MSYFAKSMFFRDGLSPLLDRATIYFHCSAAILADKVMVVCVAANAVDGLTIVATKDVYNIFFLETLQCSIDCRESNSITLSRDELVHFLGACKSAGMLQSIQNASAGFVHIRPTYPTTNHIATTPTTVASIVNFDGCRE